MSGSGQAFIFCTEMINRITNRNGYHQAVTVQSIAKVLTTYQMDNQICSLKISPKELLGKYVSRNNVSLTRKQYYSSLSWVIRANLILRRKGNLVVNTFGKIMFGSQKVVENANNNWCRLRVDPVDMSEEPPTKEQKKLIGYLLEAGQLKEILSESIKLGNRPQLSDRIANI
jgi:hypothetical protein